MNHGEGAVQVSPLADGEGWACAFVRDGLGVRVELAEEPAGSGQWSTRAVEVRGLDGGSLTVSRLRSVAHGEVIRLARSAVAARVAASGSRLVFANLSDPPHAFRSDRRGRAARTDEDYAWLAWAYLRMLPEARRLAASRWAQDFPEGGNKRTWANRLTRARKFIDGDPLKADRLKDEGMALVFGEGWQRDLQWDHAFDVATMIPGGERWRKLQRDDGQDPRRLQARAQRATGFWVDGSGRALPRSPLIPHKPGDSDGPQGSD